jgi:hypothetical protein
MTHAKVRLAMAATGQPETHLDALCRELGITRQMLYRHARSDGSLWPDGFKLHLVVNGCGDLLAVCLTPGKMDDRGPVPRLARRLFGRLFGDKGYISQPLAEQLFLAQGLRLITKLRKNMREPLLELSDRLLPFIAIDLHRRIARRALPGHWYGEFASRTW